MYGIVDIARAQDSRQIKRKNILIKKTTSLLPNDFATNWIMKNRCENPQVSIQQRIWHGNLNVVSPTNKGNSNEKWIKLFVAEILKIRVSLLIQESIISILTISHTRKNKKNHLIQSLRSKKKKNKKLYA